MSFHCDSLVLVLFCLCVCFLCCFLFFGCGFVACFVFLVAVFFFSHRGIISLACTTNQKLITASASTAEFTQRVNTCITTLREQLRRWSKKKKLTHQCPEVLDGAYRCSACAGATFHLVLNGGCQDISCLIFWCLSSRRCPLNRRPGCDSNRHVLGLWNVFGNL